MREIIEDSENTSVRIISETKHHYPYPEVNLLQATASREVNEIYCDALTIVKDYGSRLLLVKGIKILNYNIWHTIGCACRGPTLQVYCFSYQPMVYTCWGILSLRYTPHNMHCQIINCCTTSGNSAYHRLLGPDVSVIPCQSAMTDIIYI